MARGEITISRAMCLGCGYCAKFCNRGCIAWPGSEFTAEGYQLPAFVDRERCTACGLCGWMCPHFAIEVYRSGNGER